MILADYSVNVQAKVDSKALDALESKIKSLQNSQININLNVSGAVNQINAIAQAAQNAGKGMSTAFNMKDNAFTNGSMEAAIARVNKGMSSMQQNTAAYDKANKSLGDMRQAYEDAGNAIAKNDAAAAKSATSQFNLANKIASNQQKTVKYNGDLLESEKKVYDMQRQMSEYWDKNTNMHDTAQGQQLKYQYQQLEAGKTTIAQSQQISAEYARIKKEVSASGLAGKSMWTELGDAGKRLMEFTGAYTAIQKGIDLVSNSVKELKEVDNQLTEISKVSDLTDTQITKLGQDAFDSASKWGKTAGDYLSGYTEMARAGFRGNTAKGMTDLSVMAQAAGDLDADTANSYLLATNAAFQYDGSVEKLTAALDGQNQVSNLNAVSMQDMAEATGKAASVASTYGVKVDQLSALIGTMQATTQQGGDAVGTALRNILMNVENTKTKTIVDTFDQIGVAQTQMVNGAKKSRSAIDILRDLHSVWQDLATDDPMRNTILNTLGGKRSANQLAALMNNWDQYEKMLAQYSQGGGSAMREAEKSANNWQGSLNRLSNTFTGLVQNFANSKGITNAINMLNNVLKVIDQITSKVGALGSLGGLMGFISGARGQSPFASAIMSALGGNGSGKGILTGLFRQIAPTELFKKTKDSIDSATQSTGKFAEGMKKGATAAKETATATGEMQKNVENSSNATSDMGEKVSQGVGASLKSLASSLISGVISAGVNMLVGMALQAVFTAVDNKIHEREYAAEKAATSYATAQESQSNLEDTESQLKDVDDQIAAIKSKGTLTLVDKAQLQDLEQTRTKLESIKELQEIQRNSDVKQAASDALDAWNKGYGKGAKYFASGNAQQVAQAYYKQQLQDYTNTYNKYAGYATTTSRWATSTGMPVPKDMNLTGEGTDKNNIADLITRNINNAKNLNTLQKQLRLNELSTSNRMSEEQLKSVSDDITKYQTAITNNQSALSEAASNIHDSMSQITIASNLANVSLTTDQQAAYKQMQQMYDAIGTSYKETDKATYDTWLPRAYCRPYDKHQRHQNYHQRH